MPKTPTFSIYLGSVFTAQAIGRELDEGGHRVGNELAVVARDMKGMTKAV